MNGRFIVGPGPRVAVYISLVKSHRRVLPRRRWGEIGRIAAGRIQRVSYRVRGNARAFLMRIKSKRAVKPECKTAMATCNRYSTRAVRSNRMRLRSHELPLAQPRVLRGGADLCAICARGCGRAASRCATRVRESLDNKEIGRRRDRRTGRTRSPRPRVGISNAYSDALTTGSGPLCVHRGGGGCRRRRLLARRDERTRSARLAADARERGRPDIFRQYLPSSAGEAEVLGNLHNWRDAT